MICILMHIIVDTPPARAISSFHRKNAIFRITSQRRDAINITSQRRDAINRVSTGVGGVSSANIRIKSLYEYLYY